MSSLIRYTIIGAFVALLLQGFQCASPELTSARKAMREKDYAKARTVTQQLVKKELENVEAHMILAEAAKQLGDNMFSGMILRHVLTMPSATAQQKTEASKLAYNLWVGEYNAGIIAYNAFVTGGSNSDAVEARKRLGSALSVKPEISEPLAMLGRLHLDMGDTSNAFKVFNDWWKSEQAGFEVANTKGIVLGMPRAQLLRTVGTPFQQTSDSLQDGGVIHRDRYDVGGRDLYVFSTIGVGEVDGNVDGWTYAPQGSLSPEEQRRIRAVTLDPLKQLAIIDFSQGNFEQALQWCTIVAKAKPSDQDLSPLRTKLYQELGRTDEALAEVQGLIKANPSDVSYRNTYASMLQTLGRNVDAQREFEVVLEKEPVNDIALFNLGALWKNLAADKQKAERDKAASDKKYKINEKAYHDDLIKAAEYYERLHKLPKYRDDLLVLEQLYNIYEVVRNDSKRNNVIATLEALDSSFGRDENYLGMMERIYVRSNMEAKAKAIEQRVKNLR